MLPDAAGVCDGGGQAAATTTSMLHSAVARRSCVRDRLCFVSATFFSLEGGFPIDATITEAVGPCLQWT
jgi:hypothetical protein